MKKIIRNSFTILVVIYITYMTMRINFTVFNLRAENTLDVIEGNVITQIIYAAIYLIIVVMLINRWKYIAKLSAKNVFVWFLLLWVFTSILWSGEPSLTLRRAITFLGTTLFGLYIATYYDYEEVTRFSGWYFLTINILSLMAIIFIPSQVDTYGWMGIFIHKNILGKFSLFGMLIFFDLLKNNRKNIIWITGFILSFVLLIGSKSTTSVIITIIALVSWSILLAFVNKSRRILFFLIILLLTTLVFGVLIYVTNNIEVIFNVFGKDTTLTGRTIIWDYVLDWIRQSPWLGYGYGAVWIGPDFGIEAWIGQFSGYYVTHAHNGYLDLWLEIGIIGVIIVTAFLFTTLRNWLSIIRNTTKSNYHQIFPIVFFIALIFYNLSETALIRMDTYWILTSFLSFSIPNIKNFVNVNKIKLPLRTKNFIHPCF